MRETAETFLEGEDELFSDSGEDSDDGSGARHGSRLARPPRPKQKPIRMLTEFTIFDSRHRNEFIVLSKIEEEDGVDRRFEVAGWVVPYYVDEDDLVGEDGEEGGAGDEVEPVYMRLGPVLRYSIDWTKDKECVYFFNHGYRFLTPMHLIVLVQFISKRSTLGIFSRCQQGVIHNGTGCFTHLDALRNWSSPPRLKDYIWDSMRLYMGSSQLHWMSWGRGLKRKICGVR